MAAARRYLIFNSLGISIGITAVLPGRRRWRAANLPAAGAWTYRTAARTSVGRGLTGPHLGLPGQRLQDRGVEHAAGLVRSLARPRGRGAQPADRPWRR